MLNFGNQNKNDRIRTPTSFIEQYVSLFFNGCICFYLLISRMQKLRYRVKPQICPLRWIFQSSASEREFSSLKKYHAEKQTATPWRPSEDLDRQDVSPPMSDSRLCKVPNVSMIDALGDLHLMKHEEKGVCK